MTSTPAAAPSQLPSSSVLTKQPSQQKMFDQEVHLLSPASSPLLHKKVRSNTLLDGNTPVGITIVQDVSNSVDLEVLPLVAPSVVATDLGGICMHMMDDVDDQKLSQPQCDVGFSCPIVMASSDQAVAAPTDHPL